SSASRSVVEEVDGLLDGGTGAGQAFLEIGTFVRALIDGVAQHGERHVGELLGDAFETASNVVELCHQRIASSINVVGWRTSNPAPAFERWIMQPGLADATTVAPVRQMAATFRSRMSAAISACNAAYAPPAPQQRPSSSSSTISAT